MTNASIPRSTLPSDLSRLYYHDLQAVAPLPDAEAEHLAAIASAGRRAPASAGGIPSYDQHGFAARQRLAESFLPLVRHLAHRYPSHRLSHTTRLDLIQVGNLALVGAIDSYTPGCASASLFHTVYGTVWRAMWRDLATWSGYYHIPKGRASQIRRIQLAQSTFLATHGREPTTAELASSTGYTTTIIHMALADSAEPVSLDHPLGSADTPLRETLSGHLDTEAQAMHNCLSADVAAVLQTLPERQRRVLTLHYGLGPDPPASIADISRALCLTRTQIEGLLHRALTVLRRAFGASERPHPNLVRIARCDLILRKPFYQALGCPTYVQLDSRGPHTLQLNASDPSGQRVRTNRSGVSHLILLTTSLREQFHLRPGYYAATITDTAIVIDTSRSRQLYETN
jgi:RNA polymerase primary sigma factor